jgi:murein DD-endopeptidase / murein LD-carboxypeptidase
MPRLAIRLGVLTALALVMVACSSVKPGRRASGTPVDKVLTTAEGLIGTRYCPAGTTPSCFDCSGFTSFCFGSANVTLPRTSQQQYGVGTEVARDALRPGDLVFFRTSGSGISHVGIYAGDDRFVHASTSAGVITSPLTDPYWRPRYVGARRVLR